MGKFKADQINNVLKNSGARTVFITLHELFPRADWSPKFPELAEKGLADWWDQEYASLSKTMSKTMSKDQLREAGLHRNRIFQSLKKISNELAPKGAPMRNEALNLSGAFNALVKGFVEGLPKGIEKTNFEKASASLLLRLSGALEAQERGERPEHIEATLKAAEESQRLKEITGEPPDRLKIMKGEGALEYLKNVMTPLGGGNPSVGKDLTSSIMRILEQEKPLDKVGYLEHLASVLGDVRGNLLKEAEGAQRPDGDLAIHAILITEAMTPEYSSSKIDAGKHPRQPVTPELEREMYKRAEEVHVRAKEEVFRERWEEREPERI
jgi:hypothetical protein